MSGLLAIGVVSAVTLAGAVGVLTARETMRLVMSLGAFLLGVAGLYLALSAPLLAAAQVFLYVGGVLVLFIFAIMSLRREPRGVAPLAARFDLGAAVVAGGIFFMLVYLLWDVVAAERIGAWAASGVAETGKLLLGTYLVPFELTAGLLLAALVAAVTIAGRGGRR